MRGAIARVEPLTTARALRGPYDYRLTERLGDVDVGTLLEVPFGHQRLLGVVVDIAERSNVPAGRLVEPISALEAGVSTELVELGLWVAREYCSTPARGLELVLPPGTGTVRGQTAARTETVAEATPAAADALEAGGLGPVQRRALELLIADGGQVGGGALAEAGVARDALVRLERRGLVKLGARPVRRRPQIATVGALTGRVELSPAQRAAADRIVGALDEQGCELLLHGVTGSGKTEVYLAAAEEAIARGLGVIVLVPEIAMTPQALARFTARFGDSVAILHSKLSAGERRDEWHRLRSGEARICVGPRSAIFAPIDALGLVVVDEEHDGSYKQEGDPKYDAREVARRRAASAGAALVLGSATPRPESWSQLERLELPDRVDGRALPAVEVVDMRDSHGQVGALHPRTRAALAELGETQGKGIVLVNRRGWAPHLACRSCGWVAECPQCDVSLVVHRAGQPCRCHHCGHAERLPEACPECGSVTLARAGAGTQRIEELIGEATGGLPVFRLDADTTSGAGSHAQILAAFEAARSGVLVGTQMVAKGHDFPDVVLAVVVDADATLRFPDFRAEERTFALVAQLAGRSGRGERGGRVIVQTLTPDAPAIRQAAQHDAGGFIEGELARRRELGYPPYAHVIRIELGAVDVKRLETAAQALREALDASLPEDARALGPAPRFRLRGRERRQIVVKAAERASAVAAIRETVHAQARAKRLREIRISVDVDAQ
jgi:primosomal protein N' (replication factor Y)